MKNIINKIKTNKKYQIKAVLVFILLVVISYFIINKPNKKIEVVYKEPFTLEIGEETNTLVSVKDDNVNISTRLLDAEDKEISDVEVGKEYKLEVTLTNSKGKETKEVKENLKVVDTTKPVITVKEKEIKIDLLQKFDVDVKVEDNSREVVRPDIDTSKVEYAKNGEYEVIVTAKDKSGNEAKETVKVIVNGDEKTITKEKVEEFTTTTGITIINLSEIKGQDVASTSSGNKNQSVNNQNTNTKQNVNNNSDNTTVKSQEQIAKEQAEAQRKAQQEELNRKIQKCKEDWGRWTGSECVWDTPAQETPKQEAPVVVQPQPEQQQEAPASSCNIAQLEAEYKAYAEEWATQNPTRFGGWNKMQQQDSGYVMFVITEAGTGKPISETVRQYNGCN